MKSAKRLFIEKYIDQSHRICPSLEYDDLEEELLEAIEKDNTELPHKESQPEGNERKLYEWIKATPENLPKVKGNYLTRRQTYDKKDWLINEVVFNPKYDDTYLHEHPHVEYLREVDLKWPSEPAIKEEMLLSGFTESDAQNAYEHGFRDAIQWLQQQLNNQNQ